MLTIRSGETDLPVAGAQVRLQASTTTGPVTQSFVTDNTGAISVPADFPLSSAPLVDLQAAGYLDRATLLRAGDTGFSLWPAQSSTGLDEQFSSAIAYSASACPAQATGLASLRRFPTSTGEVRVSFGSSLQDPQAEATFAAALARLNTALSGTPAFIWSPGAAGANVFTVEIDPAHSTCTAGPEPFRASTSLFLSASQISGGRLTFCTVEAARSLNLVLHELGHAAGLYHAPTQADVMYCSSGRPSNFTSRERLVFRLARLRRPGNRWPDNDRQTTAALEAGHAETAVFTCGASRHD